MTPDELNASANERQTMIGQLQAAESALRSTLQAQRVDVFARAHMERALAHVREASAAICDAGRIRTWEQLLVELQRLDDICRSLQQQRVPAGHNRSIHR